MARNFFGRKKPCAKEIVYAAGLFDGEGSIAVARAGELAARIQMTDTECLRRVSDAFGGKFYKNFSDRRNCKDGSKRKPIHQLSFNGYEALWFLKIIATEMRNPRQLKRTSWLLQHWNDYASKKHEPKKPPRWQMYIDFHKALPGGNRKHPFVRYEFDKRSCNPTAHFPGNPHQLKRRRERYKNAD